MCGLVGVLLFVLIGLLFAAGYSDFAILLGIFTLLLGVLYVMFNSSS